MSALRRAALRGLLAVAYLAIVTPIALAARLRGRRPFAMAPSRTASSYWVATTVDSHRAETYSAAPGYERRSTRLVLAVLGPLRLLADPAPDASVPPDRYAMF